MVLCASLFCFLNSCGDAKDTGSCAPNPGFFAFYAGSMGPTGDCHPFQWGTEALSLSCPPTGAPSVLVFRRKSDMT